MFDYQIVLQLLALIAVVEYSLVQIAYFEILFSTL